MEFTEKQENIIVECENKGLSMQVVSVTWKVLFCFVEQNSSVSIHNQSEEELLLETFSE